jgi:hypothetical protein
MFRYLNMSGNKAPLALRYRSVSSRGCLNFHHLVVPAALVRLWIPAFAGMTMKAKAAGMGGSSENHCKLFKSYNGYFRVGVGIGIGIDLATLVEGLARPPARYRPRDQSRHRNCQFIVTHFHHLVVPAELAVPGFPLSRE